MFSIRFFVFALLSVFALSWTSVHCDESVDDADVVVLTEKNFDEFIQQDLVLVEFYAPWCGHCKQLAPEYAVAATELKKLNVPLGKVDATAETALGSKYKVSGYPTLKIFRNGKEFDYNGPRKSSGIVTYMKKNIGPAAKILKNRSDLENFIKSDKATNYAIVGFFDTTGKVSQLSSSFALISTRLRDDFIFGRVNDEPALAAKYGITEDMKNEGIVVFLHGEPTVYKGSSKQKELEDFLRTSSTPLIGLITEQNQDVYNKRGLPIAKVFMKTDGNLNSKNTKYYTNRLKAVAEENRDKIIVALAEKKDHKAQMENLNVQNDDFAFAIEDKGKWYRYEPEDEDKIGKFDGPAFKAYIEQFLAGDATEYVRSERVPKQQGPVTVVVGTTFEEIVDDDDKDVMIEFYAPWCGHCKALEPKYKELAEKFKNDKGIVIAKIDATANDYPRDRYEVKGYPSIYFKPAGKKAITYEGGREVDEMVKFIKSKAKTLKGKKDKKNDKKKKSKKNKKKKDQDVEQGDDEE